MLPDNVFYENPKSMNSTGARNPEKSCESVKVVIFIVFFQCFLKFIGCESAVNFTSRVVKLNPG